MPIAGKVVPAPGQRRAGDDALLAQHQPRQRLHHDAKDTNTDQAEGRAVEATLKIGETPFTAFRAEVQGKDEIAIFPQHGADSNGSPQRGTS
jgi:hypothetical protein